MKDIGPVVSRHGLENHGIVKAGTVHWNYSSAALYEEALRRGEGTASVDGALVTVTGRHTGRAPDDKFTVEEDSVRDSIDWGDVNRPMAPEKFEGLRQKMLDYLEGRQLFVQDCHAGADPEHRLGIRVVTEHAWHNLFARNMFIQPDAGELREFIPDFTVIQAPGFLATPEEDGTNSETVITVSFENKLVLIGGSGYAGEIKKSIFGVLNYMLPPRGVLPMHCSANVGPDGDVAIFFGLSGTGKTTLSADASRTLIGDDEHGWGPGGVFNFEGGCYAKCIKLSKEGEPQIWNAIRFGSVLENLILDDSRAPDYDDGSITENTRVTYPVDFIPGAVIPSVGGHPRNVIFLTADAFGVLPPVSRLSPEQASYYFINGYTSKLAGTEAGVTEPQPNFSPGFGGPFLPRQPGAYARMLADRVSKHGADVWLLNTGWTGG
ncbi:MAG: phosphoenolpyruvate carboxykinase (ATP), partial [Proteobacteria bacterium]|nr:phosphoenolpyruvate carboxykinase (ATP) [Pseudomonadota bacterium]